MDQDEIDRAVVGVLEGDQDKFRRVIEACEGRVRLVISALLPESASVQDVAQDTFVTAFTKLGEYRPGTNFSAWIGAIARNLALNERRTWLTKQSLLKKYGALVEEGVSPRLEELALNIGENALGALRDCIGRLQEHARGVVEAFYFKGEPSAKIARQFQRPASWVFVVLHRARASLAQCLKSKGVLGYGT